MPAVPFKVSQKSQRNGQGGLKDNLFFGVSPARSWERREGIIDLLCVHILRHLSQDVHCRWDAGAAEPLVCHSVARLMLSGKGLGWRGKWRLRHFRSNRSESSATCLAGCRAGCCSSVRKKRVISDAFFHLEHFVFPSAPSQLHSVWSAASSNISPSLSVLMLSLVIAGCHSGLTEHTLFAVWRKV